MESVYESLALVAAVHIYLAVLWVHAVSISAILAWIKSCTEKNKSLYLFLSLSTLVKCFSTSFRTQLQVPHPRNITKSLGPVCVLRT